VSFLFQRKLRKELGVICRHFSCQMGDTRNALTARANFNGDDIIDIWLQRFALSAGKEATKVLYKKGFSPEQSALLITKAAFEQQKQNLFKSSSPVDGQWSSLLALESTLEHYQHHLLLRNIPVNLESIENYYFSELRQQLNQAEQECQQSA